jgi:hypothetical protein
MVASVRKNLFVLPYKGGGICDLPSLAMQFCYKAFVPGLIAITQNQAYKSAVVFIRDKIEQSSKTNFSQQPHAKFCA